MAELKTTKNAASVQQFLAGVTDDQRRADAQAVCALMQKITGEQPAMWGTSIVGFGQYTYRYPTGKVGDWPAIGLSPRKQNLTLYISEGFDQYGDLLGRLGKHTTGKSCLYLRRLSDVDQSVLAELIRDGFAQLNGKTISTGG